MKILVACEFSGAVRDAFIAKGHDAMSCDLLQTDVPGPHYQGDVRDLIDYPFDLMIAHPPCTHLSVSGARHFAEKRMDGRQQSAVSFFMMLARADSENRNRESGMHHVQLLPQAGPNHPAMAIRAWRNKINVPVAKGTAETDAD